ncbi:MAG: ribonuclease Z [Bacteroidales bacterium]|nr:ribonuclease Z [Bacteroidales bacterium]MBN2697217.1 ribonuclease Z [Bacteroidales bacterium]
MSFEVIILGSSSALPTSERFPAAHLLIVNERFFLIDCGEGTQIQLRRFRLNPSRISHIFITHLHGDHVFGLFGLLSSLGLMGRQREIHLYGPEGLQVLLQDHLRYFGPLPYAIIFHVPEEGRDYLYEDDKLAVTAIPLAHRTTTFGFLFREKPKPLNIKKEEIEKLDLSIADIVKIKNGADYHLPDGTVIPNSALTLPPFHPRSYAYISDTAFLPSIVDKIRHVDLLYHEATFSEEDLDLARENWHSTARQAAEIARHAGAGKLLIGHFSSRYKSVETLLEEAGEIFPNTVAVSDGDRFELPLERENPSPDDHL